MVDAIATQASVTKKEVNAVLDATVEVIMDTVASGDKVTLVGFGTFESRDRQAREGRNPATGAAIQISATSDRFQSKELSRCKISVTHSIW